MIDAAPHPSRFQNILKWVVYTAMFFLAFSVGLFLFWLYSPKDVLQFKKEPIPVRTIREHPTAAGVVILKVDYCKLINATGRVRTSFVSSSREVFLPVSEDTQPKQCLNTELPILIPKDLPPDTYRVKFHVDYELNPIRTVTEEVQSASFTVVE